MIETLLNSTMNQRQFTWVHIPTYLWKNSSLLPIFKIWWEFDGNLQICCEISLLEESWKIVTFIFVLQVFWITSTRNQLCWPRRGSQYFHPEVKLSAKCQTKEVTTLTRLWQGKPFRTWVNLTQLKQGIYIPKIWIL